MEESKKEIIIVKQKSGCSSCVLMLVALLLIIILFPYLCSIGLLGGLAGIGGLCAVTQPTSKKDRDINSKKNDKKEIGIIDNINQRLTMPQTTITPQTIISSRPITQAISGNLSKTKMVIEKIILVNDDFSMVLEGHIIIVFENIIWQENKKEEILNLLNEYMNKKLRIYFITERISSMGDYQLKKNSQGYCLIKDIKDKDNISILEKLKKKNLIL